MIILELILMAQGTNYSSYVRTHPWGGDGVAVELTQLRNLGSFMKGKRDTVLRKNPQWDEKLQ